MFFCIPLLLKNTSRREIPISFFISHLSQVYPEGVSERGPYTVPANAAGRVQHKLCYFFKIRITFLPWWTSVCPVAAFTLHGNIFQISPPFFALFGRYSRAVFQSCFFAVFRRFAACAVDCCQSVFPVNCHYQIIKQSCGVFGFSSSIFRA